MQTLIKILLIVVAVIIIYFIAKDFEEDSQSRENRHQIMCL